MKTNNARFWDSILSDRNYLNDFGPMTADRVRTAKNWKLNKGKKILNIGSGQGFLECEYKNELINNLLDFYSLDISAKGLKRIRKQYKTKVVQGSILNIPFKNDFFDTIYCMEVLEHITRPNTRAAYIGIKRVLKKSGEIIISVPVNELRSLRNHPVGHVKKYQPESIEKEIQLNGLSITHKKYLFAFNRIYSIKSLIAGLSKKWKPNVAIYRCVL